MNQKSAPCKVIAGLVVTIFLSLAQAESLNKETQAVSEKLGAAVSSQVEFDQGQATFRPAEMDEVKTAIQQAQTKGKITEVRVISWADQEYPATGEKAPNAAVKLADERAGKIKDYISKDLKVRDVKTYNMAQRPNTLQEFFKTSDAKVKKTMEQGGAAPTNEADTGLFGLKGKASSAVVLVFTKTK